MSQETQAVRIETGEEVAFELMKFIAEKENKSLNPEEIRRLLFGPLCRMCEGCLRG